MSDSKNLPKGEPQKADAITARARLSIAIILGLAVGLVVGSLVGWRYSFLAAWDSAAIVFMLSVARTLHGRDAKQTADLASREDPGHAAADAILILASLASLAAVGGFLIQAGSSKVLSFGFGALSVVVSWLLIHTVFMLRYARQFYQNGGGVDFGQEPPSYADFAYLAFTLGMTFQVSDTTFSSPVFRRLALRHALLSYVFGTVIVAVTINLVAGLAK